MPINPMANMAVSWLTEFAKRRGPDIAKWIWENKKEALGIVAAMLAGFRWAAGRLDSTSATIDALEGHLDYLLESADNDSEARVASEWRRELGALRHAFDLARRAPSYAERKAERQRLKGQLERLRTKVSEAFVEERMEDLGGPSSRWAPEVTS
ncbi:MAG: hypothetical protein ACQEWM_10440 [Actinomycetota bacterium]